MEITQGLASHSPSWRIETHRLCQDHLHIAQAWQVIVSQKASLQFAVDLFVHTLLSIRILRKQVPGPRERVGYRFVSRKKNCDDLIAQRLLGRWGIAGGRSEH